jgi:hypothetical protein
MDFRYRNQQRRGTSERPSTSSHYAFDNTSQPSQPHTGDNSFDPRRPIERTTSRSLSQNAYTDIGRYYNAFAPQGPGSDSSSSLKPHDSVSVRPALQSEASSEKSGVEGVYYDTIERQPLDRETQKIMKGHLDKNRSHALSSFSLGYDFNNIKPVNEVIDKFNEPERIIARSWSGTPEISTIESQDRQPQMGSVTGLSKRQVKAIEKWRQQ